MASVLIDPGLWRHRVARLGLREAGEREQARASRWRQGGEGADAHGYF